MIIFQLSVNAYLENRLSSRCFRVDFTRMSTYVYRGFGSNTAVMYELIVDFQNNCRIFQSFSRVTELGVSSGEPVYRGEYWRVLILS